MGGDLHVGRTLLSDVLLSDRW